MFLTIKIDKYKIVASVVITLIVAGVIGIGYFIISDRLEDNLLRTTCSLDKKESEQAVNFIKSFGWEVETDLIEFENFMLPKNFDTLYKRYNEYQKDIGLDLITYKGKNVKRYTYKVTNYPVRAEFKGQMVYADVIIYNGKVIGGDLKTNEINGFMVSLKGRTFKEITGVEEREFK